MCNPDSINTVVDTVAPGEDRREESQKTRNVMENMSAPLACSSKSNEMYNIKSTMPGFRKGISFSSPCDAPAIDISSTHTIFHQLSVFLLIIQSLSHRMPSTHISMSLHKQCIIIMIGIINTKLFMKINIVSHIRAFAGPDRFLQLGKYRS